LLAACGGNQATTSPTSPPTSTAESTNLAEAAVTALETEHASWQFTVTTYESGTPNLSRMIAGTQSQRSPTAVSFKVSLSGKPDMRYVRVGTDVWSDTGTGAYARSKSSDNYVNMVFQPYYLDSLVDAAVIPGYEFDTVGADTVSGVAATHYRLADADIQGIVANMPGVTPADWAADLWIGNADASLLRLAWGPQSLGKVEDQMGFNYVVTSVDCSCSIVPPLAGGS
ncbi:MAG TPA: hypothetical protein VIK00_02980, partial [Candidatus Limnocylindrales bacterium]